MRSQQLRAGVVITWRRFDMAQQSLMLAVGLRPSRNKAIWLGIERDWGIGRCPQSWYTPVVGHNLLQMNVSQDFGALVCRFAIRADAQGTMKAELAFSCVCELDVLE